MSGPEPAAATLTDVICGGRFVLATDSAHVTGAELGEAARRRAGRLAELPPGSGVLVEAADPIEAYELAAAAWWAGLRVAFARTDSPLTSAEQAAAVGAELRVVDDGTPSGTDGVPMTAAGDLLGPPVPWPARCESGDLALDLLTSGTTGTPACFTYSHAALVLNAAALAAAMGTTQSDRLWSPLPPGLPGVLCTVLLPAALHGATAHVNRTHAAKIGVSLRAVRPTVVYAIPAVYELIARDPEPDPAATAGVRWWLSSSSDLSAGLFDAMARTWAATVRSLYCGSEFGTVTFNDAAVPVGVGRVLPGVHVVSEPGTHRLSVGGPMIAHGMRGADGVVVPFGGEVTTGDVGTIDADGTLRLRGRVDDRINVGADVVDPHVVEARIGALPGVDDCLVTARRHPLLGHVLDVHVVRSAVGDTLTEADVVRHCRGTGLTGGWVPRRVIWVDTVPRTPAGKPDRFLETTNAC